MKKLLIILTVSFIHQSSIAQNLSSTEKKLMDYVTKNMAYYEKLLEESVNINSGTLNIEGVKKVGDLYGKELEKAGLKSIWVSIPDSMKRAGHLVAEKKGTKGKKLFLIGHLDTVFEPDMPANPFRRLNDSTATGQGINDMKGGDVVIIAALQALNSMGLLENSTITVYMTGDEEKSAKPASIGRADFIERAKSHDIALGFETASNLNTIATGRRGTSSWNLKVTGKQGHSAGVFGNNSGYGAIYEMARIINDFRTELSGEKYLTFNPGIMAGGAELAYKGSESGAVVSGKTNIIAPVAMANGDLRYLTKAQQEATRKKMKAIVARNLPGTSAEIRFSDGIPSMAPTQGNNKVLEVISKASVDMGLGTCKAGDPGQRGAGDISYVAEYLDCVDGLGASGKGAHAPGETINLKEFPVLIQRAAILIYRLINTN